MAWVHTAGYAGRRVEAFVPWLAAQGIALLVDVRHAPWSRNPGFRGAALARSLAAHGMDYLHLPELGAPPDLRALAAAGEYDRFFQAYREHAMARADVLDRLATLLLERPGCLLCLEADPARCHRSALAELLLARCPALRGVRHLTPGP